MTFNGILSATYMMALVAKSPEARSSQWNPPTVTRRPQNGGLSPTSLASSNTRPSKRLLPNFTLVLAPLCLLHPSSSITGWRQRCSSDGQESDKAKSVPHSHCLQMFHVPSRLVGISRLGRPGGQTPPVILIVPQQPCLPTCPL